MSSGIRNSWALVKASAGVLRADKELIVFPILSGFVQLMVLASFLLPMFLSGIFDSLLGGGIQVMGLLGGVSFYAVEAFVVLFANSALVGAAMIRLSGGDPTIGDGFRIASKHVGAILVFSFFSGAVGLILRILARGGKGLGRLGAAIGGLAWNLVTYLVLPVLVVEEIDPIEAIVRSATLLKKTWGEQIVINLSTDAIFGLPKLLVFGLLALAVFQGLPFGSPLVFALVIALLIGVFLLLGLIESALKGIYVAAVYRYAAQGEVGSFFSEEVVKGAFRPK
ncbi:MAG: DUF6159 family protein [Anaerolineae bacterium]|jgi:hypothetical protein